MSEFNLDEIGLCRKAIASRSKHTGTTRRCHLYSEHDGKCVEFPFLRNLAGCHPSVAKKIERDSIMTTGAAWKSEEAGPNRIYRWVMLQDEDELRKVGIDFNNLKPQVKAKLTEKAADYDSCVRVAMWLTWRAYQMPDAPAADEWTFKYLNRLFGSMLPSSTPCEICRLPLSFTLFALARRGKAEIETCHKNPRMHDPSNVGFSHRFCNIAQGNKSLDEFYSWMTGILKRVTPN